MANKRFCHSCTAPLDVPMFQGPSENYCVHCTDETGELHPRDKVQQSIAVWLQEWQPGVTQDQALERARHFMQAMPAWADDAGL